MDLLRMFKWTLLLNYNKHRLKGNGVDNKMMDLEFNKENRKALFKAIQTHGKGPIATSEA